MGEKRCDLYKGLERCVCGKRERCGEERVKRNNRREEMTREEKRISVEKRVMD